MQVIRIAAVAVFTWISISTALAADERPAARAKYAELATKARAGDLSIDWKALRVAAAIGEVGGALDEMPAVQKAYAELQEGKSEYALKIGREIEEHNIADVDGHYLAWRSLVEVGRETDAEKERAILAALFQSITDSGDGKSAKTAWFAATIRETYLYMASVLNVEFQDHRTAKQDGRYYDVVAVKDKEGKQRILWFDAETEMHRQLAAGERASHKEDLK